MMKFADQLLTEAQQAALMAAVLQQHAMTTKKSRRLFVTGFPDDLTEDQLAELVEVSMAAAGLTVAEGKCVTNVYIGPHVNKFAFVELRCCAEATNALNLDSIVLSGRSVNFSRPNDYAPPPPELANMMFPPGLPHQPVKIDSLAAMGLGPATLRAAGFDLGQLVPKQATMVLGTARQAGASAPPAGKPALSMEQALKITRPQRRLFVGGVDVQVNATTGLTAEMVLTFFNSALVAANLHDPSVAGDPIHTCDAVANGGRYVFIEARSVAEATSCLALDGIELAGGKISVARVREYVPLAEDAKDDLRALGLIGNTAVSPDGLDVFAAPADAAHMALALPAPAAGGATDRRYGAATEEKLARWVQARRDKDYFTADAVRKELRDQGIEPDKVMAQRASELVSAAPGGSLLAQIGCAPVGAGDAPAACGGSCGEADAAAAADADPAAGDHPPLDLREPTETLQLDRMLTPADVQSEDDMADVLEDVALACAKHGSLVGLFAPRPPPPEAEPAAKRSRWGAPGAWAQRRVFVRFGSAEAAVSCAEDLHGREWEGRPLVASFVSDDAFGKVAAMECFEHFVYADDEAA